MSKLKGISSSFQPFTSLSRHNIISGRERWKGSKIPVGQPICRALAGSERSDDRPCRLQPMASRTEYRRLQTVHSMLTTTNERRVHRRLTAGSRLSSAPFDGCRTYKGVVTPLGSWHSRARRTSETTTMSGGAAKQHRFAKLVCLEADVIAETKRLSCC